MLTKAERFDNLENKWEEIANMQQGRGFAFGVATEERIFLAGGIIEEEDILGLKTCEMYNICTNEWQLIGSLNVPRTDDRMVYLKGTLCSRWLI